MHSAAPQFASALDPANDPQHVRTLTRRGALALLGAAGLALASPRIAAAPSGGALCVVRPEQTEGPFFVDAGLDRADIRSDPATGERVKGTPLRLAFAVSALAGGTCAPLRGAQIDVWQCNAEGRYSDVSNYGASTAGRKYLRGYQTTDADGMASFLTIYPAGYAGRAVHIHFKIRTATMSGRAREFTSQLYFDDAFSDRVFASGPYPSQARRMRNGDDFLYRQGGRQLTLEPSVAGDGLAARFELALALG